jgi:hypothetical protein
MYTPRTQTDPQGASCLRGYLQPTRVYPQLAISGLRKRTQEDYRRRGDLSAARTMCGHAAMVGPALCYCELNAGALITVQALPSFLRARRTRVLSSLLWRRKRWIAADPDFVPVAGTPIGKRPARGAARHALQLVAQHPVSMAQAQQVATVRRVIREGTFPRGRLQMAVVPRADPAGEPVAADPVPRSRGCSAEPHAACIVYAAIARGGHSYLGSELACELPEGGRQPSEAGKLAATSGGCIQPVHLVPTSARLLDLISIQRWKPINRKPPGLLMLRSRLAFPQRPWLAFSVPG